jgi:hypothetical protein
MNIINKYHILVKLIPLLVTIFCFALLMDCARADIVIFSVYSPGDVKNRPPAQIKFKIYEEQFITKIRTYHWNDGKGADPGIIGLRGSNGFAENWLARGESDATVENAYWVVYPNKNLPPGNYTLVDSDISTWSYNDDTDGRGFVWIFASG